MGRKTREEWKVIRRLWEEGTSMTQLGREFDVTEVSIARHRDNEHWQRPGEAPRGTPKPETEPDTGPVAFDDDVYDLPAFELASEPDKPQPPAYEETIVYDPTPVEPTTVTVGMAEPPGFAAAEQTAATDAELAELRAENEQLRRELRDASPTADASKWLWETPEQVIEHFGRDAAWDIVSVKQGDVNRQRVAQGLGRVEPSEADLERWAKQRVERRKFDQKKNSRVIKMVKKGSDGEWVLVQIPIEGQINNLNGSQFDAVARYTAKGFKIAMPMWCSRWGCNELAALDTNGAFAFSGYCSAEDRRAVESSDDMKVENVVTVAAGLGR